MKTWTNFNATSKLIVPNECLKFYEEKKIELRFGIGNPVLKIKITFESILHCLIIRLWHGVQN